MSVIAVLSVALAGCGTGGLGGYTNQWLHPQDVSSVYVEMFDSRSLRRGHEYVLTDAICKRIESETPYKILSDRDYADTVLSGQISSIGSGVIASDRYTGRPLEMETIVRVSVSWKNLRTGELLINNETVSASATYSAQLGQNFDYAAKIAVNRAAERVVELMETKW
jgi:hypothetical protein